MTEALVLCCLKMYFFIPSVISNGNAEGGGEGGRWERELSLHFSFEYSDFPFFKSHASDRAAY